MITGNTQVKGANTAEQDIIGQDNTTITAANAVQSGQALDWMAIARQMFSDSTTYLDTSIRPKWDVSLAVFNNEHPNGSRFHSDAYAHRSKVFRPKIKPAIRRQVSVMAAALFTNSDAVDIEPVDKGDKQAEASAIMLQQLLQHRLDEDLYWFLTVQGAYLDALLYSVCISKQYWVYDQTNDKPVLELIKPENFRFDPNCDSRDPTTSSPYLIEIIPLYAGDILDRIASGEGHWHPYTLEQILSSDATTQYDSTRQAREGLQRVDPTRVTSGNEFTTVFVHFNVYRHQGRDWAFYTLGVTHLLSDPVPLEQLYKHGRDLYRIGFATYESHKNYPRSIVEDAVPLQEEVNRHVNNRLDNVAQVLNKRYFIKRQGNVDLRALMRNVPGGGILVDSVDDVKWMDTPDISRAAYEEQDRLNLEIDDMVCITNQNTINSNRKLHETLGGMELMQSGANNDQELLMLTFIYSWMQPVLQTILRLIQDYETDQNKLGNAAQKAGMDNFQGLDQQTQDSVMGTKTKLKVNVGFGNTNPDNKVKKLMLPLNAAANMPDVAQKVDWDEVVKELFANAGYGDGSRFLLSPEQLQEKQQNQQPPSDPKADAMKAKNEADQQIAQMQLQLAQAKMQGEMQLEQYKMQMDQQLQQAKAEHEKEMLMIKLQLEDKQHQNEMALNSQIEGAKLQTQRDTTALNAQTQLNEMQLKNKLGSGI